jgi:putative resolvase
MKLAEWARSFGVHPQTAYRWFHNDKLPTSVSAHKLPSGTIVVEQNVPSSIKGKTVAYCRVDSLKQKDDLERQAGRIGLWASTNGLLVDEVITEISPGLNARKPRLTRLLANQGITHIIVEHLDRLGVYGAEQVIAALSAQGRVVHVVSTDNGDAHSTLNVTEMLTSICSDVWGRRGARNRALRALAAAGEPVNTRTVKT